MHEPTACPAARRQRGAAALVVTSMLFFAMVLTAMFVNRNLLVEQLSAANHDRAAKAFEAAEATEREQAEEVSRATGDAEAAEQALAQARRHLKQVESHRPH